ncbi:uncharacterized protein LOC110442494 isoform X2 [Mizuhopecten yessoensis]|uniref:Uncharacterized protein n=1 Tax=Mizuhopecten yessoensis TaxID=6573 RepID=A0A210PH26_MIZYE|nr:uncharacterized protein LOC110442494 isoform X2 [Mizuhopecten yessoensis]OWF35789.1 hypothetical protein KP79_PYT11488 [Mizuhopecten yessoensis]
MLNPGRHPGICSISAVSSNVTMGKVRPSFVNSKHARVTGQKRLYPKYAVVGVVLSTLCNPVLGVMAVFAYVRAKNAYAHGRFVTAGSYMNIVFILGIIGISMTLLAAVVIYIHSSEEFVLVDDEVEIKTTNSATPKNLGYLHGKHLFRKTKEKKLKEDAFPFKPSSSEQVKVIGVVFETNATLFKGQVRNKTDMESVVGTMMEKGDVIPALKETNREKIKTVREMDNNSRVVKDVYDLTGGRRVREADRARSRCNCTKRRRQRVDACHQLQQLLKGNSIKVRMKMKHPLFGWKPVTIKITDHTDCFEI